MFERGGFLSVDDARDHALKRRKKIRASKRLAALRKLYAWLPTLNIDPNNIGECDDRKRALRQTPPMRKQMLSDLYIEEVDVKIPDHAWTQGFLINGRLHFALPRLEEVASPTEYTTFVRGSHKELVATADLYEQFRLQRGRFAPASPADRALRVLEGDVRLTRIYPPLRQWVQTEGQK